MKAFVIRVKGHEYSERVAKQTLESWAPYFDVEYYNGTVTDEAQTVAKQMGVKKFYGESPESGPWQTERRTRTKLACDLNHLALQRKCMDLGEPVLILEHDHILTKEWLECYTCDFLASPYLYASVDVQCADRDQPGAPLRYVDSMYKCQKDKTQLRPDMRIRSKYFRDGVHLAAWAYLLKPEGAEKMNKLRTENLQQIDLTVNWKDYPELGSFIPHVTSSIEEQTLSNEVIKPQKFRR